ncbi:hypothetical protein SAMN05216360_102156 [Methylobacterium phyllostachyos]|uniref:DUF2867 domain-containing protein n=1 Tax=Methylobacterium phyllostachyos TaxID=582672 RepID=A0A1G9TE48_9HYPH|nr:hypothetical protein [Methylobacterium phyllostachyos]SDM46029.1 hypothetical protein SAMN05216360_102156 [Methylobacterium phyllostachyos]
MRRLDRYCPTYQFSEVHACDVAAEPAAILNGVAAYRPASDRFFRLMIGLRELPMRALGRPDMARAPFGLHDFTLLDRSESEIVYGLIGRFWRPGYGLEPVADGAAFLRFDAPQVAKLALAFEARPGPDGRTQLVTETRVSCASRAARLKFTPYWLLIRPVSGLVRQRMLAAIKRDSERSSSSGRIIAAGSP